MIISQKKDSLVVKHNDLVTSRHDFSVLQNRIFALLLSKISPRDMELEKYYIIHVSELMEGTGNNRQDLYTRLRLEIRKLQNKQLHINLTNGNELDVTLIASAEYNQRGQVEIEISQKLKPYLIKLTGSFTEYTLKEMLKLKSIYAQRIYENLCKFRNTGWWKVRVDDLRRIMELKDKYPGYGMFKIRVLERAKEELQNTDMAFEYEEEGKVGRMVTMLKFTLFNKNTLAKVPANDELYVKLIDKYRLSEYQAKTIINSIPKQVIGKTLHDVQAKNYNGGIENIAAYTWGAFRNQYPDELSQRTTTQPTLAFS